MKGMTFILTALLTGLGPLLPAQPPAPPLTLSPGTFPDGLYGSAYPQQTIKVSGGKPPYTLTISSGNFPPGLALGQNGVVSGTPGAAGSYSFTVTAKGKDKSHGDGNDQGSVSGSKNYTLVIKPASLTITANNASMAYGGVVPALSVSFAGFVNGDNSSSLTTMPVVTTTASSASPPGTYPIIALGAKDTNYAIAYKSGTLTIGQAGIRVIANPQTKEFGATDPVFTYSVSGLPNGDSAGLFSGSLSRIPGENAGSYPITIGSLKAGDYAINYTGSYLTITKASQQINWSQSLSVGCSTSSQIQLSAAASSGLAVTYSVSDPGIATVSGSVLTLLKPGMAVVTAVQPGNANYNAAAVVTDTIHYEPASLVTEHWNDVLFFDNSSGDYVAWQWYKNDSLIAGATNPYYSEEPSLDGQYFVIATNKDGQDVQSCTLTVTPDAAVTGGIRVFPNPAVSDEVVTIVSDYPPGALQGAILEITDISGRVLQQITDVAPSMRIVMHAANGIYIVDLLLANGQRVSTNVLVK